MNRPVHHEPRSKWYRCAWISAQNLSLSSSSDVGFSRRTLASDSLCLFSSSADISVSVVFTHKIATYYLPPAWNTHLQLGQEVLDALLQLRGALGALNFKVEATHTNQVLDLGGDDVAWRGYGRANKNNFRAYPAAPWCAAGRRTARWPPAQPARWARSCAPPPGSFAGRAPAPSWRGSCYGAGRSPISLHRIMLISQAQFLVCNSLPVSLTVRKFRSCFFFSADGE